MGRQAVMFSVFPHWDPRIGHGQRSGLDQWSAVIFLNKKSVLSGDEDRQLKPLPVFVSGTAGSLGIYGDVLPQYTEKLVARAPAIFGTGQSNTTCSGAVSPARPAGETPRGVAADQPSRSVVGETLRTATRNSTWKRSDSLWSMILVVSGRMSSDMSEAPNLNSCDHRYREHASRTLFSIVLRARSWLSAANWFAWRARLAAHPAAPHPRSAGLLGPMVPSPHGSHHRGPGRV